MYLSGPGLFPALSWLTACPSSNLESSSQGPHIQHSVMLGTYFRSTNKPGSSLVPQLSQVRSSRLRTLLSSPLKQLPVHLPELHWLAPAVPPQCLCVRDLQGCFLSSANVCVVKVEGTPHLCKTDEVGEICVDSSATATAYYGLLGITKNVFEVPAGPTAVAGGWARRAGVWPSSGCLQPLWTLGGLGELASGLEPLDPQENSVPSQGWEGKPGPWSPCWQEPDGGHASQ